MTRTTVFALTTAATLSATSLTTTPAVAAITTLGECYDAVITWCNETQPENASGCASSEGGGLDQCDDEFGSQAQGTTFDRIKIFVGPKRTDGRPNFRLKLIPTAKFSAPFIRDDNDRDSGGRDRASR